MRISDWSSDVCSSDLRAQHHLSLDQYVLDLATIGAAVHAHEAADGAGDRAQELHPRDPGVTRGRGDEDTRRAATAAQRRGVDGFDQIGRASCRERVCQYV